MVVHLDLCLPRGSDEDLWLARFRMANSRSPLFTHSCLRKRRPTVSLENPNFTNLTAGVKVRSMPRPAKHNLGRHPKRILEPTDACRQDSPGEGESRRSYRRHRYERI